MYTTDYAKQLDEYFQLHFEYEIIIEWNISLYMQATISNAIRTYVDGPYNHFTDSWSQCGWVRSGKGWDPGFRRPWI